MSTKHTTLSLSLSLLLGLIILIRFSYAAWSEPTVTPPDGNAAAPLTISSAAQNKTGPLSISSVTAYTAPGAYAPVYYDSNNTSYYIQPSNTGTSAVFAGNVGIGVTNPTRNVDVFEPTDSTVVLRLSGNRSGTNGHADRIELVAPASPAAANKKSFELINMNPVIAGGENYLDFRSINDDFSNSIDNILVINHSGSVGIGTTSPQALLTLQKAESNTAGSGGGLGYQASNGGIWHTQRMNTSHTLIWDDYNGSSWVTGLTQTNSGNVGIGTTSPGTTLHSQGSDMESTWAGDSTYYGGGKQHYYQIYGDQYGNGAAYTYGVPNSTSTAYRGGEAGGYFHGGSGYNYAGGGAGIVAIGGNGGTSSSTAEGGAGIFAQGGVTDSTTGKYAYAGFFNQGDVIVNTGNVGIGTTSPDQKLTVAGTIHSTTGGIEFPDGTTQTTAAGGSSYVSGGHYGYYAYDICGCSDIYIAPMTTSYTCPAGFTYETTGSAPGSYTCGPCGQYVYWATCVKN